MAKAMNKTPKLCALCKKTKTLTKSHVFPKSLLTKVEDLKDNLRAFPVNTKESPYSKKIPTGIYDTNLCESCNVLFSP